MKKIILISPFFSSPSHGGGITFSREICQEWLKRGYDVHIFEVDYGKQAHNITVPNRDKLFLHGLINYSETRQSHKMNLGLKEKSKGLISLIRPDEIHVHNFHGMLGSIWAAVESGIKTVYTALDFGLACQSFYLFDSKGNICDGPDPKKCLACIQEEKESGLKYLPRHLLGIAKAPLNNFLDLRKHLSFFDLRSLRNIKSVPENLKFMLPLFEKFDHVVAPSPPLKSLILKFRKKGAIHDLLYPVAQEKVAGTRAEPFRGSSNLRLLFLGNLSKVKGWEFFLDVLESLPEGLNLEVVDGAGNVPLKNTSRNVRRYLKASKRMSSLEISQAFNETDATIVPSLWYENTPLVVLESLANGCPVIASDQPGISHVVRHFKNGFLLPPGDKAAWASALTQESKNPKILREMRTECSYTYSVSQYIDALEIATS